MRIIVIHAHHRGSRAQHRGGALDRDISGMVGLPQMGRKLGARLWIGGFAGAGMYAGHILAAHLAGEGTAAGPFVRLVGQEAQGSGFHPPAWLMAVVLAVIVSAVVGFVVDRSRTKPPAPLVRRFAPTLMMLGTIQMIACGGLCVMERVWFGNGFTPAMIELEVGVSLAVQVLVATVSALLITLLAKLAGFIARILREPARAPRDLPLFGTGLVYFPRPLLLAGGTGVRGPPL